MKNIILIITIMLASACDSTTPTMKSVVGEYEYKKGGHKFIFLENGTAEGYVNGKKQKEEYKWSIVDGEIHVDWNYSVIEVYRINADKSITLIANLRDGKRQELVKDYKNSNN